MYEFKQFSKRIVWVLPFVLILAAVTHFFHATGRAISLTLLVLAGQILFIFIIGKIISIKERTKATLVSGAALSKSGNTRRSIVEDFVKKYAIRLDYKQIDLIVQASYSSPEWEKEIRFMAKDYNMINEWYLGETGWLHIYLQAIKNITVTSDFEMQYKIVLDAFTQIINEKFESEPDIDHCIRLINRKYLAYFDEVTFMSLCSYMKKRGYSFLLPANPGIRYETEMELLMNRYRG